MSRSTDTGCPAARKTNAPRFHVNDAVDDHPAIVERDHVNWKSHPAGMNAPAGNDPQPLARLEPVARQQPDRPRRAGIRHRNAIGK